MSCRCLPRLFALAGLLVAATVTQAATLYDASPGTAPAAQGWFSFVPAPATGTVSGGRYTLNTSPTLPPPLDNNLLLAGSTWVGPLLLDTASGFDLTIVMQVVSETHVSDNRAGFSLIAIGNDPTRSIELGFREDRVFAYAYDGNDADRFVPGPTHAMTTTDALHAYRLSVRNDRFSLFVDEVQVLGNQPLFDYTPFTGSPDVYDTPNFLFFGDDTTRAGAVVSIAGITLTPVPLPAALPLLLSAIAVLGLGRGRGLFAAIR